MRALAPTILLVATPALAASPPPATAPETEPGPAPAATVPTPAVIEKLGHGDRLFLAADYRNALFTYLDAVYMQPNYAPARVKLGRAYLALRYQAQAVAQAEAALAADPESAEARRLLEDARKAPSRSPAPADDPIPAAAAAGAAAAAPAPAPAPGPRIFRLTTEPAAASAPAPARAPAAVTPAPAAVSPAPPDAGAAEHYRAGVLRLQSQEFAEASTEFSSAIAADPSLTVAYVARGSAHFGLGKYAAAAEDYRSALRLDPKLAMPLYGLAECHRVLGDAKRAAEMYERYAKSTAPDVRDDLRATATKRARDLR